MGVEGSREKPHREPFAIGMEHNVYRPHGIGHTDLLKTPRLLNTLTMLGRNRVTLIHEELEEAQRQVKGTNVKIPTTRVYAIYHDKFLFFRTMGYVMRQEPIKDDGSVDDIPGDLKRQGLDTLADECLHEPKNFIPHEGTIYWVDPTKGPVGRVLESSGIMSLPTYRRVRRKLSNIIRFFGL